MKLIVAVSKSWAIGKDNKLLFSLKEDMKFFKRTTLGKVVVMGKNTFLSLPHRPLKDRVNIVLSSTPLKEECLRVDSLDALFDTVRNYDTNDVYVIGGARMYKTLLPYCDTALVTKVDADADADTFFPDLDSSAEWELVSSLEAEDEYRLTFCTYKNKKTTEYKYENRR